MSFTNPSTSDFKAQFTRDFPYSTDPNLGVLDSDISSAFVFVNMNMNPDLWPDQPSYNLGYLLLAAHYLVLNLRASSQGLNGQFNWAQNSKAVGSVSEGFQIPERILNNPELMMLTKTNYGAQFLQLVLPQLAGQMFVVAGSTHP
jgi:hypothetical protein